MSTEKEKVALHRGNGAIRALRSRRQAVRFCTSPGVDEIAGGKVQQVAIGGP